MPTIPTVDRMGLVMVHGEPYQIVDIGMRMLTPRELFNAQGFPADYIIDPELDGKPLTARSQVRMCGNSVSPPIAEALVLANCGEPRDRGSRRMSGKVSADTVDALPRRGGGPHDGLRCGEEVRHRPVPPSTARPRPARVRLLEPVERVLHGGQAIVDVEFALAAFEQHLLRRALVSTSRWLSSASDLLAFTAFSVSAIAGARIAATTESHAHHRASAMKIAAIVRSSSVMSRGVTSASSARARSLPGLAALRSLARRFEIAAQLRRSRRRAPDWSRPSPP
jgi:hypothetical protein